MLSNAYLLANFRFDTAENDPGKCIFEKCRARRSGSSSTTRRQLRVVDEDPLRRAQRQVVRVVLEGLLDLGRHRDDALVPGTAESELLFPNFCKFLAGSFSAVSKRNFARKYAFDSIFQALQDLHPFAPLQSQNFSKKSV